MKSKLPPAILFSLVTLVVFLAERVSAIQYDFSGVITEAISGNYGVAVGNTFSGYLVYDRDLYPDSDGLGVAVIDIQTVNPSPDIVFYSPLCTLTVGSDSMFLVGNPFDFFGWLSLSLDNSGAVTGGSLYLNSEPFKNSGSFGGIINVPDGGVTAMLLAIGWISLALFRRASRRSEQ